MSSPQSSSVYFPRQAGWVLPEQKRMLFWRALPVTGCCFYSKLTARGRHSTKNKKGHHPIYTSHSLMSEVSSRRWGWTDKLYSRPLFWLWGLSSWAQSSLSDRVSYCSDSKDCHTRCWATGAPACGGCCCWLCMAGEAMEVGGVLLSMRMVSGL